MQHVDTEVVMYKMWDLCVGLTPEHTSIFAHITAEIAVIDTGCIYQ